MQDRDARTSNIIKMQAKPDTFHILAEFLDQFGPEVQGRELVQPPEEIQTKLQQFARGSLSEEEQAGLFPLLQKHPDWTAWLAQEVKCLRVLET